MGQPGFFDVDERLAALSAAGDPLERLSAVVDSSYSALCSMRRWRVRIEAAVVGHLSTRC